MEQMYWKITTSLDWETSNGWWLMNERPCRGKLCTWWSHKSWTIYSHPSFFCTCLSFMAVRYAEKRTELNRVRVLKSETMSGWSQCVVSVWWLKNVSRESKFSYDAFTDYNLLDVVRHFVLWDCSRPRILNCDREKILRVACDFSVDVGRSLFHVIQYLVVLVKSKLHQSPTEIEYNDLNDLNTYNDLNFP